MIFDLHKLMRQRIRGALAESAKPDRRFDFVNETETIHGTVAVFQTGTEGVGNWGPETVWTFRIERFDAEVECPANFVPVRNIRNWHERSLRWHEARGINRSRW